MSAVIWCGIVAVWIFVLIPTWVRRGDIHWHRGAAAINHGSGEVTSGATGRWLHLPGVRRFRRSGPDQSVEVDIMDDQSAQAPAEQRVSAAVPRGRVAAAPSSGRLGSAVRASFGTGSKGSRPTRKKPALRVRRARRLVALAVLAFVTLVIAIVAGGLFIVAQLMADLALVLYIRHLRGIARERQAKLLREKRARAARQAWDQASAQVRADHLDGWRAPAEPASAAGIDLTEPTEPVAVDLTDAPTEELAAAQAS